MSDLRPSFPTALPGTGVFLARVVNVNDPENQNRIQVSLGAGDPPDQVVWAQVVVPLGANLRGESFLPSANDEVLIAFRSGDPRAPVILGGLWKGSNPPPETGGFPGRQLNLSALTGASGTRLEIVEDPSGPTIQVTTPDGSTPPVDEIRISIHIGGGIEISAPSSQIAITAAGAVTISAPQLSVEAGMANFSGVVKCDVLQANTVIAASYTPGAGNIW